MNSTISKLKLSLAEIGKSEYSHNNNTKDFLFNDREVSSISEEYFVCIHKDFNKYFTELLSKNKVDKNLIKFLFEKTTEYHNQVNEKKKQVRASYVFLSSKDELREGHERTHEVINSMINAQRNTLKVIHDMLGNLYNELDYLTKEDIESFKVKVGLDDDKSQLIRKPNIGKVTINLSKKDSLSLLLVLEHLGYLDFNNTDRNHFIENNFNYKSNKELIAINSEISNIISTKKSKVRTNKTSLLKLIGGLITALEDFKFDSFLNSMRK